MLQTGTICDLSRYPHQAEFAHRANKRAIGDFNVGAVPVGVSPLGAIIMSSGSTKLAEHRIPRMISGETLMGVCVTEPSGGSDASAMKLHCRRDGDFYVLDGEKTSITFADCADTFIVFARTGFPEAAPRGVTAGRSRGYTWRRTRPLQRRWQPYHRTRLDLFRERSPAERERARRGEAGHCAGFDFSRALIALQCVGCAQASLEEA